VTTQLAREVLNDRLPSADRPFVEGYLAECPGEVAYARSGVELEEGFFEWLGEKGVYDGG
jgi:hypothetical protein